MLEGGVARIGGVAASVVRNIRVSCSRYHGVSSPVLEAGPAEWLNNQLMYIVEGVLM